MQLLAAVPEGTLATNKLEASGAWEVGTFTRLSEFTHSEDTNTGMERRDVLALVQQKVRLSALGAKAAFSLEKGHTPFPRRVLELALLAVLACPEHALAGMR